MKISKVTAKDMNRRCEKLKSLGLEIQNEDSSVVFQSNYEGGNGRYVEMDFSAIDESKFAQHAMNCIFKDAFRQGKNDLRDDLTNLLCEEKLV